MVEAYLVHDILERVWAINSEAHKDDVGLGVGERSQSVVLLLSGSVPECKLDHLACWGMGCVGDVVLEDGGYIFLHLLAWFASSSLPCDIPLGSCRSCS
jgi:hypothetical protein